jgi:hypothetical protein
VLSNLAGLPLAQLGQQDFETFREFVNLALPDAWEAENWPELILTQERYFRDAYDAATAYVAPTITSSVEVWYPAANRYYQTLRASTGQVPATVSGSVVTENSAYWAESTASYSGDTWLAGTVFTVGRKTLNPQDGRYYQCHTAHTAGGTFDASKFGVLTPFDRYVATAQTGKTVLGEVVRAYDRNPLIFTSTMEYAVQLDDLGAHFQGTFNKVWLQFSRRCPSLTGEPMDVSRAYAVGNQVYWSSDTTDGNFYNVVSAAAAGVTPDTTPASFSLVELPYIFQTFVTLKAFAYYLSGADGQMEKASAQHKRAEEALEGEMDKVWRRQHQVPRISVMTR